MGPSLFLFVSHSYGDVNHPIEPCGDYRSLNIAIVIDSKSDTV